MATLLLDTFIDSEGSLLDDHTSDSGYFWGAGGSSYALRSGALFGRVANSAAHATADGFALPVGADIRIEFTKPSTGGDAWLVEVGGKDTVADTRSSVGVFYMLGIGTELRHYTSLTTWTVLATIPGAPSALPSYNTLYLADGRVELNGTPYVCPPLTVGDVPFIRLYGPSSTTTNHALVKLLILGSHEPPPAPVFWQDFIRCREVP